MTLDSTSPLSRWTDVCFGATSVFEELGIDYSCNSGESLENACRSAGIAPERALVRLYAIIEEHGDREDWSKLSPPELCRHIEAVHHAYTRREIPRLIALAEEALRAEHAPVTQLEEIAQLLRNLGGELETHMRKEEQELFPLVAHLFSSTPPPDFRCGSVSQPILHAETDHGGTDAILLKLREARLRCPSSPCPALHSLFEGLKLFESDLHVHIHKENQVLLPAILEREEEIASPPL